MSYAFSSVEADQLASFALDAATQIDRIRRDAGGNFESVYVFANAVAQFAGIDADASASTYYLDPSSSEILSCAVTHAFDKSISNVDSLNVELSEIVDRLKGKQCDETGLAKMERFCLEIHNLILKNRSSVGLHERGAFDYEYSYSG